MREVMLDFEAFGNGPDACVVQIGACYFDRDTGEIGETSSINVDAQSGVARGAKIDASTVYWWLSQSAEAIKTIKDNAVDVEEAFNRLNYFLKDADTIWSHATFDFVILQETLKRLNIKPRYSYRAARDIRTLMDLSGISPKNFTHDGIAHNGLDDCVYQVKYTVAALKALKGAKNDNQNNPPSRF